MRYRVTGTSRETGHEVNYLAESSSPEKAQYLADLLGMFVSRIEPPDVEPQQQHAADELRSRRKKNSASMAAQRWETHFPKIWRSD